ncbi:uncharacterized protein METZ01_LOCUS131255, partial [marine metagenome]
MSGRVTFGDQHLGDRAVSGCFYGDFHFHGFHD